MNIRDPLTHEIIGSAISVSKEMGVGLLESAYEICLRHELDKRGLSFDRQPVIPVVYDSIEIPAGFRPDLIVEQTVIVEIKAVSTVLRVHKQQLLTYIRLSSLHKGLLFNFHSFPFTDGIVRMVI